MKSSHNQLQFFFELMLIFLSNIESHFLRRMETPGPLILGCGLNLELSNHSIEWGYLVRDYDMEPVQHWGTQP